MLFRKKERKKEKIFIWYQRYYNTDQQRQYNTDISACSYISKLPYWPKTIVGEYITHLRFADDIVVMAESLENLGTMLEDLNRVSQQVGLRMNMDKTKLMSNVHVAPYPVSVGSSILEIVDKYVYLGQTIQLGRSNFEKEVNRRIQLGWAAFGKLRNIFSSKIPQCLKTKVYNQCVLPVMTYGSETWPLTIGLIQKLKVAQSQSQSQNFFICLD